MELNYVWDTNTVIYYLQTHISPSVKLLLDNIIDENKPSISAITEIELQAWQASTDKDLFIIQSFISDCMIIELDLNVKQKTIQIRKQTKLKLPDAIIAASALVYGKTLITRNVADFSRIQNLKILNPFD